MKESLVELGGLGEEKLKRLQPRSRMIRCMSKTPSLGNSANPWCGDLWVYNQCPPVMAKHAALTCPARSAKSLTSDSNDPGTLGTLAPSLLIKVHLLASSSSCPHRFHSVLGARPNGPDGGGRR